MDRADYVMVAVTVLLGAILFGPLIWEHRRTRKQQTYDPTRSIYDDLD